MVFKKRSTAVKRRRNVKRRTAFHRKRNPTKTMAYLTSRFNHTIVPDRYFVWLEGVAGSSVAGGVQAWNMGFVINELSTTFTNAGSATHNVENGRSFAGTYITGLGNLLYNSTTSTGLWQKYRVWTVINETTFTPQALGDQVCVVGLPIAGVDAAAGGITTVAAAPNNKLQICSAYTDMDKNMIRHKISIPEILGISRKNYAVETPTTYGTYATPPTETVTYQYVIQTMDAANLANALPYLIKVRFYVEFFGRVDYSLLINE